MIERNLEYETEIFRIVKENPQRYGRMLRAKGSANHNNPSRVHLLKYIFNRTSFLDNVKNVILPIRLLYLRNPQVQSLPKCCISSCQKLTSAFNLRYFPGVFGDIDYFLSMQTCCKACSNKMGQLHREKYYTEKYGPGIVNVFQLEETKKKAEHTKEILHGDPNYCNREKIEQTNLNKYGTKYFFQTDEFQRKAETTKLKHFGYKHQMQCPEIKEKMTKAYYAKHGVLYSVQNPDVIKKAKRKYFYNGMWFDSGWEIAYYKWLTDNGIPFEFHPMEEEFLYSTPDGKQHRYYPDFLVKESDDKLYYVEIKSDKTYTKYTENLNKIWDTESRQAMQEKFKLMLELEKQGKLKILQSKDIDEALKHIRNVEHVSYDTWKEQFRAL